MARTIQEIYDQIVDEKDNQTNLSALLPDNDNFDQLKGDISTSKVARWRLWASITATAIFIQETLFDLFRVEVDELAAAAIPGTAAWLQNEVFRFQLGDSLVVTNINRKAEYPVIDESKQIIKRAAVVETANLVTIKVAKEIGGIPVPLNTTEKQAFDAFIRDLRFAGVNDVTVSKVADLIKAEYDIHYDPLILAADGSLIDDPGTFPVEDAINGHFENLLFNGALNLTALTDAIQAAEGVNDPRRTEVSFRFGFLPFEAIIREYISNAGYVRIDPAEPLNTTLNYIADV